MALNGISEVSRPKQFYSTPLIGHSAFKIPSVRSLLRNYEFTAIFQMSLD